MRTRRGNPLTSFILVLAVFGVTATFMGLSDVFKDAFGSLANIADMTMDDFRDGDIVHGTITETIGCAATKTETHYRSRGHSTTTTFYYYVVPFFGSNDSPIPEKIILYRTGNNREIDDLSSLTDETFDWYVGTSNGTSTSITFDRAEVREMNPEEWGAFLEYIDEFIDAYYIGESEENIRMLKDGYENAMVPYVVTYSKETHMFLYLGLGALGLLTLIFIFAAVKNRGKTRTAQFTYIGSSDPNLNAATGLQNASDDPYFTHEKAPQVTAAMKARYEQKLQPRHDPYTYDYSNSQRPMPPLSESVAQALNKRSETMAAREMNFDPFTGRPLKYNAAPANETMPTVDPKSEKNVDLSNGGIAPDEKEQREFVMPFNGAIPVINPDSAHNPSVQNDIGTPAVEEVAPIHPATSAENISIDFQVQQTDPSTRGMMSGVSGGEMNAVDPYTEKNVDISNGGIELDDATNSRLAGFPTVQPVTAPTEPPVQTSIPEPAFASMPDISFPTAEPLAPPPEPVKEPEPAKEPDGYNIFKTDSSSYNIFKTDTKPIGGSMGFPNESSFPELNKSFPSAGESDVGGQDDFNFKK